MAEDNLLATLEQGLRQARAQRARLTGLLVEAETEVDRLRTEVAEIDSHVGQTEATMLRILSSRMSVSPSPVSSAHPPSDVEIEAALRHDAAKNIGASGNINVAPNAHASHGGGGGNSRTPLARHDLEVKSNRFNDRTIPQAAAMVLRESNVPLHVNEIYNQLLEGGFQFSGQHPTISIAVSLNRSRRFRKAAPGTFDLTIRDAAQVS